MKLSYGSNQSINEFQKLIEQIYSLPDDRLFSIHDILSNTERFTMRALKGIRKNNKNKVKQNLLIAFSWLVAIANRLHINLEKAVWERFPGVCSYCGHKPCICKKEKIIKRVKITKKLAHKPLTILQFQEMFEEIYPSKSRGLADAGIHLAEETGEISESINLYLGEHKKKQFVRIAWELGDWTSCMFGVANSYNINITHELVKMFANNCHVCHQAPCRCNFNFVYKFRS